MILAETVLPFHLAYSLNRPQRLEMSFATHATVSRAAIPTNHGNTAEEVGLQGCPVQERNLPA